MRIVAVVAEMVAVGNSYVVTEVICRRPRRWLIHRQLTVRPRDISLFFFSPFSVSSGLVA
jgi:hypothetical protein